eukprot:TRINITY_DN3439_c0_g2_i2.p1 TRINITY_DN3439_c0_g2~~TRINITY_DN3439_c0_g2_i2.p1  ORF type:complete len:769 (-),score=161.68 TRINITY_DN3439_c0_g2_i2:92-2398(-)
MPEPYEGELASSILLDDGDAGGQDVPGSSSLSHPLFDYGAGSAGLAGSPLFGGGFGGIGAGQVQSSGRRGLPPHQRSDGEAPNRTPTRTPSPDYQWSHVGKDAFLRDHEALPSMPAPAKSSSSSGPPAAAPPSGGGGSAGSAAEAVAAQMVAAQAAAATALAAGSANPLLSGQLPFPQMLPPMWPGALNPQAQAAYYSLMMNSQLLGAQATGPAGHGSHAADAGKGGAAAAVAAAAAMPQLGQLDPAVLQVMMTQMALQGQSGPAGSCMAAAAAAAAAATAAAPASAAPLQPSAAREELEPQGLLSVSQALPPGPQPPRGDRQAGAFAQLPADGRKGKSRGKMKEPAHSGFVPTRQPQQHEPGAIAPGAISSSSAAAASPKGAGGKEGKGDRRARRGGKGDGGPDGVVEEKSGSGGGKAGRPPQSSPLIEQLKAREKTVELSELALHLSEIAQDQYGSRLIQQKLEVASEEQKRHAFKSVLLKMNHLTTDVFGNYVIQKFFEYGNAEQRRILAEQLVGQVLKLSLQMYGCRVVQKALDYVPIDQQVLLIGELKGNVIKCIEDQHGNHVIQKCIERLPTDRIGFIVDSFLGSTARMAKHCYGCRVLQRLIEYCASAQITGLLDEVLRNAMELATDQYGNYVVQHVMEHSSRPGDRQMVMEMVRKNMLSLACHKYASNVIEKALTCGTLEERAMMVETIVGAQNEQHSPLLVMMRDRFGNYIIQRVIGLAQGPQRDLLFWKLREHMPVLKKSNTYGKHIISAMEKAQSGG